MSKPTEPGKPDMKKVYARLYAAGREEMKKIKNEEPSLTNLVLRNTLYVHTRRPDGFPRIILHLLECLTISRRHYKDMTQAELLNAIRPQYPEHKLMPNIWQRKLTSNQLSKAKTYLWDARMQDIVIDGCNTLSQIKKKIDAGVHKGGHIHEFQAKVVMDKNAVSIGDEMFPIEKRSAKGKDYFAIRVTVNGKREWLRVDTLFAFLRYGLSKKRPYPKPAPILKPSE